MKPSIGYIAHVTKEYVEEENYLCELEMQFKALNERIEDSRKRLATKEAEALEILSRFGE